MILNPASRKELREHIQRRLVNRLRLFLFIIFILFDFIIYEISMYYIQWWFALLALVLGTGSGYFFSRRKKIYWEAETSQVIGKMDQIGTLLLILYIVFAVARHVFLQQWLDANEITGFALSFALGSMSMRVYIMRRRIRRVLKMQQLI